MYLSAVQFTSTPFFPFGLNILLDVVPPLGEIGFVLGAPIALLLNYLWNLLILVEALALLGHRSDFSRRRLLIYTLVATIGGALIDCGHYVLLHLMRQADWFARPLLWSSLSMLLPVGLISLWNLFLSRSELLGLPRREAVVVALLMGALTAPWPILFLVTPWKAVVNLRQKLGLGVLLLAAGLLPGLVHFLRQRHYLWKRYIGGVGWVALAVVGLALTSPESLDRLPAGLEGRIVYTVDGQIYVLDARSGERHWLAEGLNPMWSPDGESIAFARPLDSEGKYIQGEGIYVLATQDRRPRLLLTGWTQWWEPNERGKPGPHCPTWSRDGRWIVIIARERKRFSPPPPWEEKAERGVQGEWTSPLAVGADGQAPPMGVNPEENPWLDLRATVISSDGRYRIYSAEGYLWLEDLGEGKCYRIARGEDSVWWHPQWRE